MIRSFLLGVWPSCGVHLISWKYKFKSDASEHAKQAWHIMHPIHWWMEGAIKGTWGIHFPYSMAYLMGNRPELLRVSQSSDSRYIRTTMYNPICMEGMIPFIASQNLSELFVIPSNRHHMLTKKYFMKSQGRPAPGWLRHRVLLKKNLRLSSANTECDPVQTVMAYGW